MIEVKRHKGGTAHLLIHWKVIDLMGLEVGDEVMLNRDGEDLYIYRINPLGVREGTGFRVTNPNTQNKGFTVYTNKILNYVEPGESFNVDEEYVYDNTYDVEMYLMEKIQ